MAEVEKIFKDSEQRQADSNPEVSEPPAQDIAATRD